MTVIDLNGGVSRARVAGRFSMVVNDLRDYLARKALYRQTMRELNALSTRELDDLGLGRSDIANVAYKAAWGEN